MSPMTTPMNQTNVLVATPLVLNWLTSYSQKGPVQPSSQSHPTWL